MSAQPDVEIAFAVMEDDTVVCSECLPEVCDDREPATAANLVHAWVGSGEPCRCCGYDGTPGTVPST